MSGISIGDEVVNCKHVSGDDVRCEKSSCRKLATVMPQACCVRCEEFPDCSGLCKLAADIAGVSPPEFEMRIDNTNLNLGGTEDMLPFIGQTGRLGTAEIQDIRNLRALRTAREISDARALATLRDRVDLREKSPRPVVIEEEVEEETKKPSFESVVMVEK